MADEATPPEDTGTEAKPSKFKIKLGFLEGALLIQGLILSIAAGLVVKATMFTKQQQMTQKVLLERTIASIQDDHASLEILELDPFRVKMADKKMISTKLSLELSDAPTAQKIKDRMPAVKARILDTLSAMTTERMDTIQGKLKFKEALRESLNEELSEFQGDHGIVRDVFLLEFVMI